MVHKRRQHRKRTLEPEVKLFPRNKKQIIEYQMDMENNITISKTYALPHKITQKQEAQIMDIIGDEPTPQNTQIRNISLPEPEEKPLSNIPQDPETLMDMLGIIKTQLNIVQRQHQQAYKPKQKTDYIQ